MYEESMQMPFVIKYPKKIKPGSVCDDIICNVDFAPTFLELAGLTIPSYMQGVNFSSLLQGVTPDDWRQCAYYRYWVNQDGSHNVFAHYGIRTKTHKLIYFYNKGCGTLNANPGTEEPEWELFDLEKDPLELFNEYNTPEYQDKVKELTLELNKTMAHIGDIPLH